MANGDFTITVVDEDGIETTRTVDVGAKISSIVPSGRSAILNGVRTTRDNELRANDRVEYMRKSGKAAS